MAKKVKAKQLKKEKKKAKQEAEAEKAAEKAARQATKDAAKQANLQAKANARNAKLEETAMKKSTDREKHVATVIDKKLEKILTDFQKTSLGAGANLVPDVMKATFVTAVQDLTAIKLGCAAIARGLAPADGFTIPVNVQKLIDLAKKHEAVLILNMKAHLQAAQLTR